MNAWLRLCLVVLVVLLMSGIAFAQDSTPPVPSPREDTGCEEGGNILQFEMIDDLTFTVTLCQLDYLFPARLSLPAYVIYPAEELYGFDEELNFPLSGTGPYRVDSYTDNGVDLARNEDYWGDAALEEKLSFVFDMNTDSRLPALQSGNIDGFNNPTAEELQVGTEQGFEAAFGPDSLTYFVGLNNQRDAFADPRVRQAIAYAIDPEALVEALGQPGLTAANQLIPNGFFGYLSGFEGITYDPVRAQELLADAGYLDLKFTLSFNAASNFAQIASPIIQAQLAEIGVTVELQALDAAQFANALNAGSLEAFLAGRSATIPDAASMYPILTQTAWFGEMDEEIQNLINQTTTTFDPEQRQEAYSQLGTYIRDTVPLIPLASQGRASLYDSNLENVTPDFLGIINFAQVENNDEGIVWGITSPAPKVAAYCGVDENFNYEIWQICSQTNEPLFKYDVSTGALNPHLAEGYEVSEDGLTYTIKLRNNIRFHNGTTLDAIDCICSLIDVDWSLNFASDRAVPKNPFFPVLWSSVEVESFTIPRWDVSRIIKLCGWAGRNVT